MLEDIERHAQSLDRGTTIQTVTFQLNWQTNGMELAAIALDKKGDAFADPQNLKDFKDYLAKYRDTQA
jgi:hypothetical protein